MAAYFLIGSGTGNWNHGSNWSLSSGGAAVAAGTFPLAADSVTCDINSGATSITVNVTSACLSIVATSGYTGTLTVSNPLTITSTLTLVSGMTVTGSANLVCAGSATLTSGGVAIGCGLALTAAATYTLASDFTVNGLLTLGSTSATTNINGAFTITANAGMSQGGTASVITTSGTMPTVKLGGTGPITPTNNLSSRFQINLTIDAGSGTVTWANGVFVFGIGGPTLTYVSGTVAFAGSSSLLTINGVCSLNTAGMAWNKISFTGGFTATFLSDCASAGIVTFGTTTNALILNGFALNCAGGITMTYSSGGISGTTVITATGAGTLDGGSMVGRMACPFTINAPGAAIVLAGNFNLNLSQMTLVAAGSITNANAVAWTLGGGGGPVGRSRSFGSIGTY